MVRDDDEADGFGGPHAPWEPEVVGLYSVIEGTEEMVDYDQRMGIQSAHVLTVVRPAQALWILSKLEKCFGDSLREKTVVEIGAGIGVLAAAVARMAKHVYAIEADPAWSWAFARHMYRTKPANLTWIFDRAQNLIDIVRGDIALVVTGSDEVGLRALAGRFAPQVVMPWQDWLGGRAVARCCGPFGGREGDK